MAEKALSWLWIAVCLTCTSKYGQSTLINMLFSPCRFQARNMLALTALARFSCFEGRGHKIITGNIFLKLILTIHVMFPQLSWG